MIRFINLTGQIAPDDDLEFAWYNTITDEFMRYSGSVTWSNFEDFEGDLMVDIRIACQPKEKSDEILKRFRALYPAKQTLSAQSEPS